MKPANPKHRRAIQTSLGSSSRSQRAVVVMTRLPQLPARISLCPLILQTSSVLIANLLILAEGPSPTSHLRIISSTHTEDGLEHPGRGGHQHHPEGAAGWVGALESGPFAVWGFWLVAMK